MKTIAKRLSAAAAALVIAAGSVYTGVCLTQNGTVSAAETTAASSAYKGKKPKYIFMFIGDGMSYPQIQVTQAYYSEIRILTSPTLKQQALRSHTIHLHSAPIPLPPQLLFPQVTRPTAEQ